MSAIVKKGNAELTIDESELSSFLNKGYDQIDEKGEVLKSATAGKTVSIEDYNKILAENEKLKKKKGAVE